MNWKNHIIIGFIISIIFIILTLKFFEWNTKLLFTSIPIIIYYSILPDIDHRISKMTGVMLSAATLFIVIGALTYEISLISQYFNKNILWFGIIVLIITMICSSKLIPHRGIIHTLQIAVLSPLLLILVFGLNKEFYPLYILAFVAFWSHLLADGIPLKIK